MSPILLEGQDEASNSQNNLKTKKKKGEKTGRKFPLTTKIKRQQLTFINK